MTGIESGAYELKHRDRIHRASDFNQLLEWAREYRITPEDSYRQAGTDQWIPVMSQREFASVLSPESQWSVSMKSGVFRAPDFETIIRWAGEGRITDDAVIEGPRTPPGGVRAAAFPAVSSLLKEVSDSGFRYPRLNIDGREYKAPDIEAIRGWIRDSRVPLESRISVDEGKNWETVSSCGLFDLEDWPAAAHGRVEDERLPEMPENCEPAVQPSGPVQDGKAPAGDEKKHEIPSEIGPEEVKADGGGSVPFTVVTAETEITVESVQELKRLVKKRLIFSYDEISHPSIKEESISVGEYLEGLRKRAGRKKMWLWAVPAILIAAAITLELTGVVEIVPWF